MGLGTGILLIAVGAVMKWGLTVDTADSFNLDTIGTILFVIGILGVLISLAFWNTWGGAGVRRTTRTYDEDVPARPAAYYDPAVAPVRPGAYYDPAAGAPRRTTIHEETRDSRY